ncbi:MAG: flagellar biosynthesis anti-sigma factor FlgM [Spirochaetota bacterium]
MTIERLGPVDPVQRYSQTDKTKAPQSKPENDSVAFSEEAKLKADMMRVAERVNEAPDVRADRVEEVRRKLLDPNYIDNRVVEHVAEQIMDMFNL